MHVCLSDINYTIKCVDINITYIHVCCPISNTKALCRPLSLSFLSTFWEKGMLGSSATSRNQGVGNLRYCILALAWMATY